MKINELIKKHSVVPQSYERQINIYKKWCVASGYVEGITSLVDYLLYSLEVEEVKKSTWEVRLQAVKSYLSIDHGLDVGLSQTFQEAVFAMRSEFKTLERKSQMFIGGAPLVQKQKLTEKIMSLPVREKAISLVNLETANRPSDMVAIRIKDFDFENGTLNVYLVKEKRHHIKNLTPHTVDAVKGYVEKYQLHERDYFVGRIFKNGVYQSVKISEVGYSKALKKWTGTNASTLRKAQISSMHEKGADIPTIKKQTGIWCEQTIINRHLKVSSQTVKKYI